jgi:hypothetical protein
MSQFRAGIDVSKGTYNIIKGNSSGLWIGTNSSTVDINSSKLNISSSNISIVTRYDGVEFLHNPIISLNSLEPGERSRHIPTTEWVNSYFDSRFSALNLQLNADIVPYGVNLLELKHIPFQTSPSSITPTLPDNTTRVSILVIGPGGRAGANISSLSGSNVSLGIGGAGGSGGVIYYPSIHCNFSRPFNINFSYSVDENSIPVPSSTMISYSDELLTSTNVSLRSKTVAIAYGGLKGVDTTEGVPGAQGNHGTGVIYYTYGQSVCQPGSFNISGNGEFYSGLTNVSKTLKNYGGNNLLSYEIDNKILDNVGGSNCIVYNTSTVNISTINPGKGGVYMWCWNDSTTLQLNSSKTFNVSNGQGTQYNRMNNESNVLSYRDTLTGPEKIFSITNVSHNCSIMYIDAIESKPLDFYTSNGYRFNASVSNMSIFPSNTNPIKVKIGENASVINNSENTIQLGNENVVTRVSQLNALDESKKLMIGNLQSTGGISIGTDRFVANTVLLSANSSTLNKMEITSDKLNMNVSNVSLGSGGVETFTSDQTGNITIGGDGKKITAMTTIYTNSNIVMTNPNSTITIGTSVLSLGNGSTVGSSNAEITTSKITVNAATNSFIKLLDDSNNTVFIVDSKGNTRVSNLTVGNGNASITTAGEISGTSATIYGPINVSTGGVNTASISSVGVITGTSMNVSNSGTSVASISSGGLFTSTGINVKNAGNTTASISSAGAISGTSATIYGSINVSSGGISTASISSAGDITGKSAVFTNGGTINASISSAGEISGTSATIYGPINVSNLGTTIASISSTGAISGTSATIYGPINVSNLGTTIASISSVGVITGTSINVSSGGVTTATITSAGDITGKSAVFTNAGLINASISSAGAITGTSINVSSGGINTASISSTGVINGTSIIFRTSGAINASISSGGVISGTSINVSSGGINTASISSAGAITGTSAIIYGSINVSNGGSINVSNAGNTTASITSLGEITGTGMTINGRLLIKNSTGNDTFNISSNGVITGYNNVLIFGDITTKSGGSVYVAKDLTAATATIDGAIIAGSVGSTNGNITAYGNIISYGNITTSGYVFMPNVFTSRIDTVSSTTTMTIGDNTNGGIMIGTGTPVQNTLIMNANNASINKMQINASNMSINTESAVFKVLKSLGLTVNSNNILTLDTSGNTTLGHQSNVTMINSSLCLFNTSTLSLNSNGLNTIFSDTYGNVTVGNSAGTTSIMSLKQINFNTPLVTFNTPITNSTPKGLSITNSGIVSYANYQSPGVAIYCGESSSLNTTEYIQDPFCICSPSGGINVSSNVSGSLTLGMGVDTNGRFGYINCAEFGLNRDIYLASKGNASVYIGNPGSQIGNLTSNLYVNGQTTITGNTVCLGTVSAASDINLKKDIFTVENAIDKVKKLRGVNFTYIKNDEKSMGVIAQEIQEVIPEVVSNNNGTLTVNYCALSGVFIEAIKEMFTTHDNSINELKEQINELRSILNILTRA